jgi:hypothetical protein
MPKWISRKVKELNEINMTIKDMKEKFNKDLEILEK